MQAAETVYCWNTQKLHANWSLKQQTRSTLRRVNIRSIKHTMRHTTMRFLAPTYSLNYFKVVNEFYGVAMMSFYSIKSRYEMGFKIYFQNSNFTDKMFISRLSIQRSHHEARKIPLFLLQNFNFIFIFYKMKRIFNFIDCYKI